MADNADNDVRSLKDLREHPDRFFGDPMEIVDAPRYDYELKLDLLQRWLARVTDGQAEGAPAEEVEAAIFALQARAKLADEEPREAPEVHNYGGVERSDLRRYSVTNLARRVRGYFRR
ncbi:hypothetical protein SAMN05444722_2413 [Rhodovulum sp. ES.010]|uniref:hypothetical protein n=1 Tax=Rhodovulum sp. ES.010 TaxID=1882821 RepID=UPI00092CBED0|nr:hypothetical protein [Rhodovulum sp. ES.010]SIO47450.1 hypothetical protein SAMN05444722_2413 [Rhodovulum sp. ES.010]